MKGNTIILSSEPRGKFEEFVVASGESTLFPGMFVRKTTAALQNGRASVQHRDAADGAIGPICILVEDNFQGGLPNPTAAFTAGARVRGYWPVQGEEMNCLLGDVPGTADIVTRHDLFGIASTGKIKANSSYTSPVFEAIESLPALTADTLVACQLRGQQA
jgi:hypothetical protein